MNDSARMAFGVFVGRLSVVLLVVVLVLFLVVRQGWGQTYIPISGYTPIGGGSVMVGTNGIVSNAGFWTNNVVGVGDLSARTNESGRLELSVTLGSNTTVTVSWDSILDVPAFLADTNALAAALNAVQTEVDPAFGAWLTNTFAGYLPAIQLGATSLQDELDPNFYNWLTNTVLGDVYLSSNQVFTGVNTFSNDVNVSGDLLVGGSEVFLDTALDAALSFAGPYSFNSNYVDGVVVTGFLANGYAGAEYDAFGSWMMSEEIASSQTGVWESASFTTNAVYWRLLAGGGIGDGAVSNVTVYSWANTDLFEAAFDTAGQRLLVDNPVEARQVVNKRTLDAAVAAVQPGNWSAFAAESMVQFNGQLVSVGGGWTMRGADGEFVLAAEGSTLFAFAYAPGAGMQIAALDTTTNTITLQVATNGVWAAPILQWTDSLVAPVWQNASVLSNSFPDVNTNGHWEIVADKPAGSMVYLRAISESVLQASIGANLVPTVGNRFDLGSAAKPFRSLYLAGETLYLGTNSISTTATNLIAEAFGAFMNDGSRFHSVWSGATNSLYVVSPDGAYTNLLIKTVN